LALLQYAVTTLLVWIGVSGERLATGVLMARLAPPRRGVARTLFVGTPAACREAMTGGPRAGFVDVATPPAADALGDVADLPALKGRQLFVKRAVDIIGALLGLAIAAPLMLIVAAAIKLDSAGPVIFGQERIGTGGRRFRVLKFRTMRHGAPDTAHRELIRRLQADDPPSAIGDRQVYKLTGDERVTRVGRWLRRTSLDELP